MPADSDINKRRAGATPLRLVRCSQIQARLGPQQPRS